MKNMRKFSAVLIVLVVIAMGIFLLSPKANATGDRLLVAQVGAVQYESLQEAVNHANGDYVKLLADVDEAVTAEGDLYLDLNGKQLSGLSVGGTLYCMDSTATATTAGTGAAKVTGTVKQDHTANGVRYIVLDYGGVYTAHVLTLELSYVTLRTTAAGIYYKTLVQCDPALAAAVEAYGVALSVHNMPGADFQENGNYTRIEGTPVSGETFTSGSVFGIFKEAEDNAARGAMKIYANAYIDLKNGACLMSDPTTGDRVSDEGFDGVAWSLQDVLAALDSTFGQLEIAEQTALVAFGDAWENIVLGWGLNNLHTHTLVIDDAVAPTCGKTGLTEGEHCSVCGMVIVPQEVIPATGAHTFGEWQILKEATTTEEGVKERVCGCGAKETQTIEKIIPALAYSLNVYDQSYTVTGIGTWTDPELIIPNTYNGLPVKGIGNLAFKHNKTLTSVMISDGVLHIGEQAFYSCSGLQSITIPDSIIDIASWAFDGCSNLLQKENGVSYVGKWAVDYDNSATSVVLRENTVGIAGDAFFNADQLTSIVIPDRVKYIGAYAFMFCRQLTDITLGNGIEGIGYSAFNACSSLRSITLPDSVKNIGEGAFASCGGLVRVVIGNGVTSIGRSAFGSCTSLESVTIGNGVVTIGDYAFNDCYKITSVILGSGVRTIGDYAFVFSSYNGTNVYYMGTAEAWKNVVISSNCTGMTKPYYYSETQPTTACKSWWRYVDGVPAIYTHIEVADKAVEPTCTETGLTAGKHCASCGEAIVAQKLVNALGHRKYVTTRTETQVTLYTTANSTTYPFTVSGNQITSTNKGNPSSAAYTITAKYAFTLELEYKVSSEANYDILTILHNSTTKVTASGTSTTSFTPITITMAAGDVVKITYAKDGSYSYGNDCAYVKIITPATGTVMTEKTELVTITESNWESYASCTEDVACDVCGGVAIPAVGHDFVDSICRYCGVNADLLQLKEDIAELKEACEEIEGEIAGVATPASEHCAKCNSGSCKISFLYMSICGTFDGFAYQVDQLDAKIGAVANDNVQKISQLKTELQQIDRQYIGGAMIEADLAALRECLRKSTPSEVVLVGVTSVGSEFGGACITGITIPASVTSIDRYAFYGCGCLTSIVFEGTVAQWNAIAKGDGWDYDTGEYMIYCTDGNICKNHSVVVDAAVAPVCGQTGLTEGSHCSECGMVLVAQTVVPMLEHDFVDGYCQYCGVNGDLLQLKEDIAELKEACVIIEGEIAEVATPTSEHYAKCNSDSCKIEDIYIRICGTFDEFKNQVNQLNAAIGVVENDDVQKISQLKAELEEIQRQYQLDVDLTEFRGALHSGTPSEVVLGAVTSVGSEFGGVCITGITIPASVTSIGENAFHGCRCLTSIIFEGTVAGWNAIEKGDDWDFNTGEYIINCTDGKICKNHTAVIDAAVAPTCSKTGLTEGSHCSVCGEVIVAQEIVDTLDHQIMVTVSTETTETLYTKSNSKTYPFTVSGNQITSTNKTADSSATYTITAERAFKLELQYKVSSEANFDKLTILHNSTTMVTASGTSTTSFTPITITMAAGDVVKIMYAKDYSVNKGDDCAYIKILTPATGTVVTEKTELVAVNESNWDAYASCTEDVACGVCGGVAIEKIAHTEAVDAAVAPTCRETGLTEGSHCSVCGVVIVAQTEIPIVDHDFADGYCRYCGVNADLLQLKEDIAELKKTCEKIEGEIAELSAPVSEHALKCTSSNCPPQRHYVPACYTFSAFKDQVDALDAEINDVENDDIQTINQLKQALQELNYRYIGGAMIEADLAAARSYFDCGISSEVVLVGVTSIDRSSFMSSALVKITIPASVTRIGENAFFGCRCLTSIIFEGTVAQWNAIEKGDDWDFDTGEYIINCTDGNICKNHSVVVDAAVAPVCGQTGLTEGSHCSECGVVLVAQTVVPMLSHNLVDGVCQNCGAPTDLLELREDIAELKKTCAAIEGSIAKIEELAAQDPDHASTCDSGYCELQYTYVNAYYSYVAFKSQVDQLDAEIGKVANDDAQKISQLKTQLQQIDRQYYGGAMIEADLAAAKAHLQSSLWS